MRLLNRCASCGEFCPHDRRICDRCDRRRAVWDSDSTSRLADEVWDTVKDALHDAFHDRRHEPRDVFADQFSTQPDQPAAEDEQPSSR